MSANLLLLWMSARGQGTWQQFRASVEQLHIDGDGSTALPQAEAFGASVYQQLRFNLQRFGHSEFFDGTPEFDWRVSPPCIATTSGEATTLGTLIGARSDRLVERLRNAASAVGVQLTQRSEPTYPDLFVLGPADQSALAEVAARANMAIQRNAPQAILACLPPVSSATWRSQIEMPIGAGWRVDRFAPESLTWRPATMTDASTCNFGLFRLAHGHQRHTLLRSRGNAFAVQGQVGKYLVMKSGRRNRGVLRLDRAERILSVASSCRPPILIERALVLCSGSPPFYEKGELHYRSVSPQIAQDVAAILNQELR